MTENKQMLGGLKKIWMELPVGMYKLQTLNLLFEQNKRICMCVAVTLFKETVTKEEE